MDDIHLHSPAMRVAAIPRNALISDEGWQTYLDAKNTRDHGLKLDYYEHDEIEECPDLMQIILFAIFHSPENLEKVCIFTLPDGTKTCGVAYHITDMDPAPPGTISFKGFEFLLNRFANRSSTLKIPPEYLGTSSTPGFEFPLAELPIYNCEISLPIPVLIWGPWVSNHVVQTFHIYTTYRVRKSLYGKLDSMSMSFMDFLCLPNKDELSSLIAQRHSNWFYHLFEQDDTVIWNV